MPSLSELDVVDLSFDPARITEDIQSGFYLLKDYSHFIAIIEYQLRRAFGLMEANPKFLQLSEDEITDHLRVALNMAGVPAEHDAMEGGHADVVIKSMRYKWIAEAKIKDDTYDYGWLWDGFMQLTERYATNTAGCYKAGFLVYVKQPNSSRVMMRWKKHMTDKEDYTFTFQDLSPQEFSSTHEHTRFGTNCEVTHFCLSVYFDPVK